MIVKKTESLLKIGRGNELSFNLFRTGTRHLGPLGLNTYATPVL